MLDDIRAFHEKFGLAYNGQARELPASLQLLKLVHLYEELEEYLHAVNDKNLLKAFDALIDIVYVALGTAYLHGFPFEKGWKLVHEANMKKVRASTASDSKRNSEFDIVKPPDWKAPRLEDILNDG